LTAVLHLRVIKEGSKMNRYPKVILAVAALAMAGAGVAFAAHEHEGHGGPFGHHMMLKKFDAALDAVKASPAQKQAIEAARDHVFATIEEVHKDKRGAMQQAMDLFTADRIDQQKLAALRAQHQADAKKIGDSIVVAVQSTHDALTSQQRQQLVAYLKQNQPMPQMHERHAGLMKQMVSVHVDDMLDKLAASDAQRKTIHAAVDKAIAQVQQNQQDHMAAFAKGLQIFAADKLDQSKIAAFRAEREAAHERTGDAIVAAIQTVHDTLTPAQRQQLVSFVKEHHGRMGFSHHR
jgi:Spy/CpxP family protein refolding chaperone